MLNDNLSNAQRALDDAHHELRVSLDKSDKVS